jgi:hypothetical protein
MAIDVQQPIASLAGVDAPPSDLPRKKRFGGRRARLLIIAVLVLGLGGVAAIYRRSTGRSMHGADSGPVRTESDTTTGIVVDIGQVVTFGGIILENFSNRPAVLESIRIDPPLDPGMTLVDVQVAGKERGIGMVGTDLGFPPSGMPPEALRPLRGAVVPPRHEDDKWGVEVLMAFKLNRPGRFGFHHALIDYRIGDKRHRIRVDDGFVICGPRPEYQSGCDIRTFSEQED